SAEDHPVGACLAHDFAYHRAALRNIAPIDHEDHPDPHVERSVHLVVGDPTPLAYQLEDRRHAPRLPFETCGQAIGEAAGQVAQHAAAGDMSGAFPPDAPYIVEIGSVRLEDHLTERPAKLRENVAQWHVLEHLAHERVAVGV